MFFPIEPDAELGWRLNSWDAATNKILAMAGRQKIRDFLDTLFLHQQHLHLAALVWAAGKDPGRRCTALMRSAFHRNVPKPRREFRFPGRETRGSACASGRSNRRGEGSPRGVA
jgi:hypothetical protein